MHLAETLYSGSIALFGNGGPGPPGGAFYPDPLLANCTKHNVSRHVYEIARLAHDVSGGILATMPFETDLRSREIGKSIACSVEKANHLAEMMHLAETLYSGSIACSAMGARTPGGAFYPDPLLANCTKHNVSRHVYEIARLAHDVSGGILATMPFETDLRSREIGKYVEKYMAGVDNVSPENRIRVLRLIENLTGGTALVESMHGAGSPQTQKVMYARLGNLEMKKKMAKRLTAIDD